MTRCSENQEDRRLLAWAKRYVSDLIADGFTYLEARALLFQLFRQEAKRALQSRERMIQERRKAFHIVGR
jgi:hypothetical protein